MASSIAAAIGDDAAAAAADNMAEEHEDMTRRFGTKLAALVREVKRACLDGTTAHAHHHRIAFASGSNSSNSSTSSTSSTSTSTSTSSSSSSSTSASTSSNGSDHAGDDDDSSSCSSAIKCLVFSTWEDVLSLAAMALHYGGVQVARLTNGSADQRARTLMHFKV
jgi:hypothetical protein